MSITFFSIYIPSQEDSTALVNLQHVPYNFANLPHLENVNR